jgi:hypothetical protein
MDCDPVKQGQQFPIGRSASNLFTGLVSNFGIPAITAKCKSARLSFQLLIVIAIFFIDIS